MGWILIAVSLILLWIASSWKVPYSSPSSYAKTSLNSGEALSSRNVSLVVAHPDDESM